MVSKFSPPFSASGIPTYHGSGCVSTQNSLCPYKSYTNDSMLSCSYACCFHVISWQKIFVIFTAGDAQKCIGRLCGGHIGSYPLHIGCCHRRKHAGIEDLATHCCRCRWLPLLGFLIIFLFLPSIVENRDHYRKPEANFIHFCFTASIRNPFPLFFSVILVSMQENFFFCSSLFFLEV